MNEIFKDVKGYEGLYQVSNLGRVKSLNRTVKGCKNTQLKKSQFLKTRVDLHGYLVIDLQKEGKKCRYGLHRLIAQTFVTNPNNFPCVNHIDGNKLNNNIENLEWCTYSENNKHAYQVGLKKAKRKKVKQYNKNGVFIKTWDSICQVSNELKLCKGDISRCCKNIRCKSVGGYIWKYADQDNL